MNKLLVVALVAGMLLGIVSAASIAHASGYTAVTNLKFHNTPNCVAQNIDEVYWRISDTFVNPSNGQHDHLVVKGTVTDPSGKLASLLGHAMDPVITIKAPFYPDKFQAKYGYPLKELRAYVQWMQHDHIVKSEYKPIRAFSLSQHTYSWTYGIEFTNCR